MTGYRDDPPAGPITIANAVTLALNYCNFGRLALADHVCRRILDVDPGHIQARLVQGIAAGKARDNRRAVLLLRQVAALAPELADVYHHLGNALGYLGDSRTADAAQCRALRLRPAYPEAMAGLADVRQAQGRSEEAFALLQHSMGLRSNYSPSYVSYSLMCFDRSLPAGRVLPPRRSDDGSRPVLTMASLRSYGRFAHTVQEYLAVRLYCEKYGLTFKTPDWVGHRFFELDDPAMDGDLQPDTNEWLTVRDTFAKGFAETVSDPLHGRDLYIGGSPVDPLLEIHRPRIEEWLRIRPCWRPWLDPVVDDLRTRGDTIVAFHIRRTDWWDNAYTPLQLYLNWLNAHWPTLQRPVLAVLTDDPAIVSTFAAYAPVTGAAMPVRWQGLDYLQDFYILSQADIVAVSTGAFARTAVALNRRARSILQPTEDNSALIPFQPWK